MSQKTPNVEEMLKKEEAEYERLNADTFYSRLENSDSNKKIEWSLKEVSENC